MKCSVCKTDFWIVRPGSSSTSDVCSHCASMTKDSFIFHCNNCGTYEVVDKDMAIMFAPNHEVKRQLLLLKNDNVIIEQEDCATCAGVHCC